MKVCLLVVAVTLVVVKEGKCGMMGRGLGNSRSRFGTQKGVWDVIGRNERPENENIKCWEPSLPKEAPCVGLCYIQKLRKLAEAQRLADAENTAKSKRYDGYLYDFVDNSGARDKGWWFWR